MREYPGLKPADIEDLTFEQVDALIGCVNKRRTKVSSEDVSLQALRDVLFKWLGVDEKKEVNEATKVTPVQIFPRFSLTKEELSAFYAAGMPSPVTTWLQQYRRNKQC